jgi:hypothetical protein
VHCVYKFIFTNRIKANTPPYYYIGSKSNCELVGGKLHSNGKTYNGSSRYPDWSTIIEDEYEVEVIQIFEDYQECVAAEYELQKKLDVVASPEYFNLGMAAKNNFADPNYGSFKHVETGKVVRLPLDHLSVISGEYVGITKGVKHSNEHRAKISSAITGEANPFFGKKHTAESLEKMRNAKLGKVPTDEAKAKMSAAHSGKRKSAEHKAKIGRKGMIMLKNRITGESVRIPKEDSLKYDQTWVPLAKLAAETAKEHECVHCGAKSKSVGNLTRWHNDNCKLRK